jgi:hypothetical protein
MLQRLTVAAAIVGMVAVALTRVTPPSWFPWDMVVAWTLFGIGSGAAWLTHRGKAA